MSKLKIPHNAVVFVGDGRKALFLRSPLAREISTARSTICGASPR